MKEIREPVINHCDITQLPELRPVPAVLRQEKLDVAEKNRANLFSWRGQFTPQLIDYLLDVYATPGDVVADPFCGSGTVLAESIRHNLSAFGLEINPAAYAMSKFYTLANLNRAERTELWNVWENKTLTTLRSYEDRPLFEFAASLLALAQSKPEKVWALNLLFLCEGSKAATLGAAVRNASRQLRNYALTLPFAAQPISAHLGDARCLPQLAPQRPDLIITSPPYINVFNYHQNHRAILEAAGWNMLSVAHSEIGANRKHRANRFKTVVQYTLDMEQALSGFWQCLRADGRLIMIVGRESNVLGVPFYNGQIVRDLLVSGGGWIMSATRERSFKNKFGNQIKEDILIAHKGAHLPAAAQALEIAARHLEQAGRTAPASVKTDIAAALGQLGEIAPSPLFSWKAAWQNE